MRSRFESVVTLPTDDRVVGDPRCCWRATAGGSPSMASTSGTPSWWNSRRAYGATDSRYRRWASAYRVPKASDDLPDPDTPVNTTRESRGMSTSACFRLWVRAPRTETNPVNRGSAAIRGWEFRVVPMRAAQRWAIIPVAQVVPRDATSSARSGHTLEVTGAA